MARTSNSGNPARRPSGPGSGPAGRCRWPRGEGRRQAVQDAPAVHQPLGRVPGGGEGVGDALVGDHAAAYDSAWAAGTLEQAADDALRLLGEAATGATP